MKRKLGGENIGLCSGNGLNRLENKSGPELGKSEKNKKINKLIKYLKIMI